MGQMRKLVRLTRSSAIWCKLLYTPCTSIVDENRKNMQSRLENSMLGLLKSEQVVKELPLLVTQVVDKFVDDMEDDEWDSNKDEFLAGPCFKPLLQLNATKMGDMSRQLFQVSVCHGKFHSIHQSSDLFA